MIFLSASVPNGNQMKCLALRDAVIAFTKVCFENKIPFYSVFNFGITPLICSVASEFNDSKLVKIYKTSNQFFKNDNISLVNLNEISYDQFFKKNQTKCGVFIGGSENIFDEVKKLKIVYPSVKILPIASTGGASLDLYHRMNLSDIELLETQAYMTLFRAILDF